MAGVLPALPQWLSFLARSDEHPHVCAVCGGPRAPRAGPTKGRASKFCGPDCKERFTSAYHHAYGLLAEAWKRRSRR